MLVILPLFSINNANNNSMIKTNKYTRPPVTIWLIKISINIRIKRILGKVVLYFLLLITIEKIGIAINKIGVLMYISIVETSLLTPKPSTSYP